MKQELGKWDNLLVGHISDEMEQRQRAQNILKCMKIAARTYPEDIHISKNLRERDPSGLLKLRNNL